VNDAIQENWSYSEINLIDYKVFLFDVPRRNVLLHHLPAVEHSGLALPKTAIQFTVYTVLVVIILFITHIISEP
jgi:hypothetical protein